ncbi:uncharacterized protein BXZ73DRAFT_53193, partial [Epithele typhae]|uniref:uncharacterized protein n=1 Tax=Epithele typhae TaxID=378194 RepID=UPI0020081EFD
SSSKSIFSGDVSPWDHILPEMMKTPLEAKGSITRSPRASAKTQEGPRKVSLSQGEIATLRDIVDSLFQQQGLQDQTKATTSTPVGGTKAPSHALYSRLRSARQRFANTVDEDLDRKKEDMELCETDSQLFAWALRDVFGQDSPMTETLRQAVEQSMAMVGLPSHLSPQSYPHLLARLMATFRGKYANPHLALALFEHARTLSLHSFVFGCTTPVYNELIETRWSAFRDLRGVLATLEQMRVNGIPTDSRTHVLVEGIRREVGERAPWMDGDLTDAMAVLAKIERLVHLDTRQKKQKGREGREERDQGKGAERGGSVRTARMRAAEAAAQPWKKHALEDEVHGGPSRSGVDESEWELERGYRTRPLRDPSERPSYGRTREAAQAW